MPGESLLSVSHEVAASLPVDTGTPGKEMAGVPLAEVEVRGGRDRVKVGDFADTIGLCVEIVLGFELGLRSEVDLGVD